MLAASAHSDFIVYYCAAGKRPARLNDSARFMPETNSLRKTKVIATIGPACDDVDTLSRMMLAGMNVARINLSHGDAASQTATLERVREAAKITGSTVAIMVDNRGREIRTGKLAGDSAMLENGDEFKLYGDERLGDKRGVSLTYPKLHLHARAGDRILLDDGQIELQVKGAADNAVVCRVIYGGLLKNRKGISLPDNTTALDDVSCDDTMEVEFAVRNKVEYFAASFIRSGREVRELREGFAQTDSDIAIIAKIENRQGIHSIDEIVEQADGIMVARGDLGIALRIGEGPKVQKHLIQTAVLRGKHAITATQMLDSMERNHRPTRAEVNDVANAIFDGSSAVMLSGETASGAHPVRSVDTMSRLALEAESGLDDFGRLQGIEPHPSAEITEAVAQACITMANHLRAAAIFTLTDTGLTARLISKYRPRCPIFAVTSFRTVVQRLAMDWGVSGVLYESGHSNADDRIQFTLNKVKAQNHLSEGDVVIVAEGSLSRAESPDLIRVITVEQHQQ